MSLGAEPLFVPWDANEIYGHTDGVVRFIDEDTVLMTNYAQLDSKMAILSSKSVRSLNTVCLLFDARLANIRFS